MFFHRSAELSPDFFQLYMQEIKLLGINATKKSRNQNQSKLDLLQKTYNRIELFSRLQHVESLHIGDSCVQAQITFAKQTRK